MARNGKWKDRLAPKDKSGYLYYVRLRTDLGNLYKIGFTKLTSASDRLGFNRKEDDKLIDEVLLFVYLKNAYAIEQRLHCLLEKSSAFGRFARYEYMPLCENGQSELYVDDVLQLDPAHKGIGEAHQTRHRIKLRHAKRKQDNLFMVLMEMYGFDLFEKILRVLFFPLVWVIESDDRKKRSAALAQLENDRKELGQLISFLSIEKAKQA